MPLFLKYALIYLVLSFFLGAVWHVLLFKNSYKKLAIYSRIENPRFSFGLTAMLLQGLVFSYLYPLIGSPLTFGLGLFMLLISFAVFTEAAKQNVTSLLGFIFIQTTFSTIQAAVITAAFYLVSP